MSDKVKPTPIALVLCDNVYSEPSGKTALVGLFTNISAIDFPVRHSRMAIFASVTGVRKGSHAKIEIVHSETDQIVVSAEGPFPDEADPLAVVDMTFIFNHVIFKEEGTYFVRFWGNNHVLMMRPFQVIRMKRKGEE